MAPSTPYCAFLATVLTLAACGDDGPSGDSGGSTGNATEGSATSPTSVTASGTSPSTTDTSGPSTEATDGTMTGATETTDTTRGDSSATGHSSTTGNASGCTQLDISDLAIYSAEESYAAYVTGSLTPAVGGGDPDFFQLELRSDELGAFDLASVGVNDDYATCEQCVTVLEDFDGLMFERRYFQSEGTLELEAGTDAFNGTLVGSLTDVVLVEVTVDPKTLRSTPVEDGGCIELASPLDIGTAPNNSCAGECGSLEPVAGSFPDCHCDEGCFDAGNCCPDICDVGVCDDEDFCAPAATDPVRR